MKITIEPDGRMVTFGDAPELESLGTVKRQRVSHILPVHADKQIAFRILRILFGERGRVAAWTRTWCGPWIVLMVNSRKVFAHPSRAVCIQWERRELDESES